MTRREIAEAVWWEMLGRPYIWGGNDPMESFDCSGLVIYGLQSVGLFPDKSDATAHELLHDTFRTRTRIGSPAHMRRGCLLFWNNPAGKVRHVEIVWEVLKDPAGNYTVIALGASGGDSTTRTEEDAKKKNAFIKIHPVHGWAASIDPFEGYA